MPDVMLHAKLRVPVLRQHALPRTRLVSQLGGQPHVRLTLVSAPAGFGKTTLLSEWSATATATSGAAGAEPAVAWVSLDPGDNDPMSFWTYVLAALDTVAPERVGAAQALLQSGAPQQAVLHALLNDLQRLERRVHLVLDDFHVIEEAAVHEGLALVLDHLPAQVHLLLSSRVDPPLPLARLRARGQLLEVRAADLRFTPDEAGDYLRDSMGLTLTEQDVLALDGRTEGWVAALQLAALSMQGRQDLPAFIASFSGDDRYVVDYLAEEVLQRLPSDLRSFLLHTSILNRFSRSLCDAVTGRSDGQAALEQLDRQNLFIVPLDDQRRWYRYHHLFADVLRARLADEQPQLVAGLHLRASEWHEQHGDLPEAGSHALAGRHVDRAAVLVQAMLPALRRDRQQATTRRLIEALPERLVRANPVLSIAYVGTLMSYGELDGVETHLSALERWLETTEGAAATSGAGGEPAPELRTLPVIVPMYRAAQARLRHDRDGTLLHAGRALALAGADDHVGRGAAQALLGLAHWSDGDVDAAAHLYRSSIESLQRTGSVADVLGCTIALADLELSRGRLSQAYVTYQQGLAAAEQAPSPPQGTADMHTGLATLLLERGRTEAALHHLRRGAELADSTGLPQHAYRWRLAMAEARELDGDAEAALALLDEAERVYDTDFSPDVRPVAAVRARLWVRHGRLADALAWSNVRELSADDEPSHLREYEHLTLARILLHDHTDPRRAALQLHGLLDRLLRSAESAGRIGSVMDVLVLQALATRVRQPDTARSHLRRALALAQPHEHVRLFSEHGSLVVDLLRSVAADPDTAAHVRRLLAALGAKHGATAGDRSAEQLSERETEVLQLLASALDGPGIARTLVVSLSTVRTHTRSIYTKLGVSSRRSAVHRAQDLGLLSRHRD